MRAARKLGRCAAVMVVAIGIPLGAQATTLSGRASTVVEWWDTPQEESALPFYQYLLLTGRDLGGTGVDFRGYGRYGNDLANETDAESRLYYAYLEKKGLAGRIDVKGGRQFISTAAATTLADAVDVKVRNLGPFAIELYGGGGVDQEGNFETGGLLWGGEVSATPVKGAEFGLSYYQEWNDSALEKELIGLDGRYDYKNIADLYAECQFNYLSNAVSYFLGGASYHGDDTWTARLEYLYSLPVFDSTSIYSVFAVSEYEELSAQGTWRLAPGLRLLAHYTREMYEEMADADVYELGVEKIRTDRFSGYAIGTVRDDRDGQDLWGVKLRAAWRTTPKLTLGAGFHYDVFERDADDDDDTTSKRYWIDGRFAITSRIDCEVKAERIESDLYDYYNRGRVRVNVRF